MTTYIIYIALVYVIVGAVIAGNFMYVWGWGDAGYGNRRIHQGVSDDYWHTIRRIAFYSVVIWAVLFNPIGWIVLAFGRKLFRKGVWDVDGGITYERWYK
jgi:hypothetical protein